MKYEALTTPFKIGNVEIRNRFVMLPMTIEKTDNYAIGDDLIDFYEQRAIGGAGLIEIGSCYVCDCFDTHPKYHTTTGACGVWDDCFIPGLTRTAEACHKHGAKLAAQLQLCYEWRPDGNTELLSYAPSKDVVSGPFVGMPEREFTIDEIKLVVKQYGEAAKRCQKAGIDIIEIHAGIGYMVMRFISKYSNHRTDEYGGSTENRCRLLTDIIDEIHRVCGEDYPILIRYSADDLMPGGQRLEDLKEVIEVVEKHGVDAWSIQAGFHEAPRPVANQLVPEGEFIYLSKAAKQYTKLPTFPGTRINHLDVCEKIIEDGSGDAVGMARHWIAEPEIGLKVKEDRAEEVRPCIVCSRCLDNIFVGKPCKCSVNPNVYFSQYGLPQDHKVSGDEAKKKILIIGAGPAGLEAARTMRMRGYTNVTVVDQKKKACGLLNLAQVLNDELPPMVDWYNNEIKRLNIDVRLNTEVTPAYIKDFGADEVILAVGPETVSPDVPGKDNKNVIDSHALKALVEGKGTPGKGFMWTMSCFGMNVLGAPLGIMKWGLGTHILVGKSMAVIGGGFAGIEVASAMNEGREVTVIEEAKKAGAEIGIIDKNPELRKLKSEGVKILTSTRVKEYNKEGVVCEDAEGKVFTVPADTIITGTKCVDNTSLYDQMKGVVPEGHLHLIGNASPHTTWAGVGPHDPYKTDEYKRLLEAVRDGYLIGMTINEEIPVDMQAAPGPDVTK